MFRLSQNNTQSTAGKISAKESDFSALDKPRFWVTIMELQLILSENQEILIIVILYMRQSVAKHLVLVAIRLFGLLL